MSIYEKIHNMTVEEMADWLSDNAVCTENECPVYKAGLCNVARGCRQSHLNWLKYGEWKEQTNDNN